MCKSNSAGGSIRVELQDAAGQPVPGLSLADRAVLFGNTIRQVVEWKGTADLGSRTGHYQDKSWHFFDTARLCLRLSKLLNGYRGDRCNSRMSVVRRVGLLKQTAASSISSCNLCQRSCCRTLLRVIRGAGLSPTGSQPDQIIYSVTIRPVRQRASPPPSYAQGPSGPSVSTALPSGPAFP